MSNNKTKWEDIKFPIVKNVQAKTLADSIEAISKKDMPRKMNEMYQAAFKYALETIRKELNEIRGVEGKEDRVKYLEELLTKWS
jgi:hypothetical protein